MTEKSSTQLFWSDHPKGDAETDWITADSHPSSDSKCQTDIQQSIKLTRLVGHFKVEFEELTCSYIDIFNAL